MATAPVVSVAPVATPPLEHVLSVVALLVGLGLLVFGAVTHNNSLTGIAAGMVVVRLASYHWAQVILAKVPMVKTDVDMVAKLLPLLPPAIQAPLAAAIGITDDALAAIIAASAGQTTTQLAAAAGLTASTKPLSTL